MRHTASGWCKCHGSSQFRDALNNNNNKDRFSGGLVDLDVATDDFEFLSLLSPSLNCWVICGYQPA